MPDPKKPEAISPSDVPPHLGWALELHPDVLETLGRAAVKAGREHADLQYLRQGKEHIALAQRMRAAQAKEPPRR